MNKTKMSAKLKDNMAFETVIGDHKLLMDADKDVGGNNLGPRPKPLVLAALMGCTGMDVMSILEKMRVEIDDLEIKVEADNTLEHPRVYENINLTLIFKGKNLPKDKISQAVQLSERNYCGVTAMLKKSTEVNYEIILED